MKINLLVEFNREKYNLKNNESQVFHYLWSANLSKSFSQMIMSIFIFSQYFFSIDFSGWESVGLPHIAYIVIH